MKSLFGNIILEIQNNVNSSDSTSVLVCPFEGLKSSSELPMILFRGMKATTFDVTLPWARSAASLLGFVIANFPFNSAYSSISLSVPPVEEIIESGVYCFKIRIHPTENLSEFEPTTDQSFMIEVTDLKTGKVVESGVLNQDLVTRLSNMHSIGFASITY
ncbi:hypothetical protein OTK49_03055 [Vibrio coralliirubri]|uniref:hypothetical protein n=1 Tax=Vibrio coralliirubri TaxID=1516159 RepID=UPI002283EF02|nr:hypothetical protein [Vibrio coralliirubri]MCY9861494.1 hypothetical protein [Vibrio coralliirubri]